MQRNAIVRSPQDLGKIIAEARHQRGLSQRQLAAEFGVSQAWLSRVEQGHQKLWLGQVLRLAVHLGIELRTGTATPDATGTTPLLSDPADYPDLDELL